MSMAIRLAARATGRTRPNPLVGCVIVQRGGQVVGRGYHQLAGAPHAEVFALRAAGSLAAGATVYVNLEPCSHFGRTPPCCEALIQAGVARVVVAMSDPNPLVAGGGLQRLQQAGIEVSLGVGEAQAQWLNAPFVSWITRGRPLLTIKSAASLDGKTATHSGESQWITGDMARTRGQRLRDTHDVVLVGSGTVAMDNPRLTCRLANGRDPIRLVVDSTLAIPEDAQVFTSSEQAPLWIATTDRATEARRAALEKRARVQLIYCKKNGDGRVDLVDLMGQLGKMEVTSVLSEAGGRLTQALLDAKLADRLELFLAPKLIGGRGAPGILHGEGVSCLADAWRVSNLRVTHLGEDLLIQGDFK
ncbi:MAG: bifunctional diaminohydroxyphosphoribosylaminopyrimidine deaminase/5-amino-6-(5-phosphoribosylamino)uracil reductase RibD [Magnetococcus sp. DMHC-6]